MRLWPPVGGRAVDAPILIGRGKDGIKGKSERAKRKFIKRALKGSDFLDPRFAACAPTQRQAKKIFWNDLKTMIPPNLMARKPNESELEIYLITGSTIFLAGLDNPARIEGSPIDGALFDETDDIKASAWEEHIDPCFLDRGAWGIYTGVPNGLAYLYELSKRNVKFPDEWDFFTWKSSEVMPQEEIEKFRSRMDERSFQQEFEAQFLNFSGRVYYAFTRDNYKHELVYNPNKPLIFALDFNTSPGIAVVCQEQIMPEQFEMVYRNGIYYREKVVGTGIIGQVHIPQNSNTELVCNRLYNDWKGHKGDIVCFGDAAGGNKTSSSLSGSDWDIIKKFFANTEFRDRITYDVPRANPSVRGRINSVNSRCKSANGIIRLMVDAVAAPMVIEDFERTTLLAGGSGEIDKKKDSRWSHWTDGLGYYIDRKFSVSELGKTSTKDI